MDIFGRKYLEHIRQHLFEADMLSPSSCAKHLGISESYMHRLFAQRGLRFSRYILDQRLDAAYVLLQNKTLRTNNTIASIAYQCGFKDPGHFSRVFKQRFNASPRDYRSL
jgi:Transcriptional regulator containing an amidase domain and an AraC-type DNA-binding HTH domain